MLPGTWYNTCIVSLLLSALHHVTVPSRMVEGHSVHRVCELHRRKLVGSVVRAVSPNGRFAEGAAAIDGAVYSKIIAIGKNLFAFFTKDSATHVVPILLFLEA